MTDSPQPRTAVPGPCDSEAATIAAIARDRRAALPKAHINVLDNDSVPAVWRDDASARHAQVAA